MPQIKTRTSGRKTRGLQRAGTASSLTATKTTDSKGRVVLGGRFANRSVIVEKISDTEILVKLARVIPEDEAWLYENPVALKAVRKGLAEARAGKIGTGPALDSDVKFVDALED